MEPREPSLCFLFLEPGGRPRFLAVLLGRLRLFFVFFVVVLFFLLKIIFLLLGLSLFLILASMQESICFKFACLLLGIAGRHCRLV